MNQKLLKRFFDFIISLILLIILVPLFFIIAVIVYITMGLPILYCQTRPGFKGKPFKIYKFRTMNNNKDKYGNFLSDEERITKIGKILRSTSLDELPELFNVLKGDMSLVGPRPLLMEYLDYYTDEQMRRHDVKPGITGWAQINGRNNLSWEEKFELDVWYVDNWSIWLDIKILFLTIIKVIKREGISAEGYATMPKFTGK
ncbi:sugar transferase [Thermoanaerobacterium thermosaccharolyticum]|uniref:sugar transferase n=1 Tax=Thermoanaerobacterium thermosaccharolyticum TaxID=1517 RepID=UPI003DA8130B